MGKLNSATVKQIETEYQRLQEKSRLQLEEHKAHLKRLIGEAFINPGCTYWDGHPVVERANALGADVDAVKLVLATVAGVDGKPVAQVVYEYPDELLAYLRDPKTPLELQACLSGGVELP